jgi:hypothetical protein
MVIVTTVGDDAARQVELAGAVREATAAAAHLSAAIRGFTTAGDRRQAALACARLGDVFALFAGNLTAGRAWYLRATRLLEDEPPCIEQGWVAVAALGCDVDDPGELLSRASWRHRSATAPVQRLVTLRIGREADSE